MYCWALLLMVPRQNEKSKLDWNGKRQAGDQECETRAVSQWLPVHCRFKCPLLKHFSHKSQGPLTSRGIPLGKELYLPHPFHRSREDNLRMKTRMIFKLIWKNRWHLFPTGKKTTNLKKPIILSISVFWTHETRSWWLMTVLYRLIRTVILKFWILCLREFWILWEKMTLLF